MPGQLILVAGYAASGKTRVGQDLARRLPGCYLDKDTLATPLVERLLAALNLPAGDRDSSMYRQEIRPLEYEALVAAGLEAASLGATTILSAPFLAQLIDDAWVARLIQEAENCNIRLHAVWVSCDVATLRQRMSERNSPRDRAKLVEWEKYSDGLNESLDKRFKLKPWRFDNAGGSDYDAEFARLLTALKSASP